MSRGHRDDVLSSVPRLLSFRPDSPLSFTDLLDWGLVCPQSGRPATLWTSPVAGNHRSGLDTRPPIARRSALRDKRRASAQRSDLPASFRRELAAELHLRPRWRSAPMDRDAYSMALDFLDVDMAVALVPVINHKNGKDVAVVGVQPTDMAEVALQHERPIIRARAAVAMTIHAHRLLAANGLRFSWR